MGGWYPMIGVRISMQSFTASGQISPNESAIHFVQYKEEQIINV
jgi:hypothetical protein